MSLTKSISGIRGTIGGGLADNLNPIDIVKFAAAFAVLVKEDFKAKKILVVVGRDSRLSGPMINHLLAGTLISLGVDVLDIGLAATPTAQMAVVEAGAQAGIIISGSHNQKNWNGLKMIDNLGEFVSAAKGEKLLAIAEKNDFLFSTTGNLGDYKKDPSQTDKHIKKIISSPLVDAEAIRRAKLRVAVDGINSVGGVAIPSLLKALGVSQVEKLNCEPSGIFAHNPEPLPENMGEIARAVKEKNCDVGFVVDPDVDRLAIVDERGEIWGEEYTLVSVADYVLKHKVGNTVSNLSSSLALKDITIRAGGEYFAAAVGEVNVVAKMKAVSAVIGGEGNGGIVYPPLHFGRDGLIGIALFLSQLARSRLPCSKLKGAYPQYYISKNRIVFPPETDINKIFAVIKKEHEKTAERIYTIDGLRLDFAGEWVHLRKSNTEPIIRIYAESASKEKAEKLAQRFIERIDNLITRNKKKMGKIKI